MVFQDTIKLAPHEKGATDITELISSILQESPVSTGICQLFVHSSSCCLLISDTADERTKKSTVDFLAQLIPSSDRVTDKIDDSMEAVPEAMRTAVMQTAISFPVKNKKPVLGTWQGIYLWETRTQPDTRSLTITTIGE